MSTKQKDLPPCDNAALRPTTLRDAERVAAQFFAATQTLYRVEAVGAYGAPDDGEDDGRYDVADNERYRVTFPMCLGETWTSALRYAKKYNLSRPDRLEMWRAEIARHRATCRACEA